MRLGIVSSDRTFGKPRFILLCATDIETVRVGLDASVRMTAFKQRVVPPLLGRVEYVSADALTDERTGISYYEAWIAIPQRRTREARWARTPTGHACRDADHYGGEKPLSVRDTALHGQLSPCHA